MSGNNDRSEREDRAFDALIVSHLLRDRDFNNLDDLPQLTESQRTAMNAVSHDIVDRLWNKANAEAGKEECAEPVCDYMDSTDELELVGMNRAEEMDEETKKRLDETRKQVLEAMRARKKAKQQEDKGNADS